MSKATPKQTVAEKAAAKVRKRLGVEPRQTGRRRATARLWEVVHGENLLLYTTIEPGTWVDHLSNGPNQGCVRSVYVQSAAAITRARSLGIRTRALGTRSTEEPYSGNIS